MRSVYSVVEDNLRNNHNNHNNHNNNNHNNTSHTILPTHIPHEYQALPEQEASNLFRLIEESPNGTEIIGVSKYLHQYILFNLQFLSSQNQNHANKMINFNKLQFNFQLLDTHDPLTNALDLESVSGKLTVKKRIDREALCSANSFPSTITSSSSSSSLSSSSSSRFPINGRPPLFLQNVLNTDKYLTNLGYFINPMHIISNNLNKRCIKTLHILSTTQILELNQVDIKKIPIDLLIIDINDNSPTWISVSNGINFHPTRTATSTTNNINSSSYQTNIPNIIVQLSEIPKDAGDDYPSVQPQHRQQKYLQLQSSRTVLPRAYDPDEGANSQVTYHLESIKKQIDNQNNIDPTEYIPFILEDNPSGPLELISTINLDYEQKQHYEFYLLATDSGLPQRTGTALIKINIIDVNDHPPIFDKSIFYPPNGGISEKTLPGTVVLNLSATDEDASPMNNRIRYTMVQGTLAMNYFSVQADGTIILKRWLDYETMETSLTDDQLLFSSFLSDIPSPSSSSPTSSSNLNNHNMNQNSKRFVFQVKAIDSAPQPYERSSTAVVIIPVIDENDEIPMISVKFLGSSEMTSQGETGLVKENIRPPIQLAYVQVRDLDFNGNDQVTCTLTDTVNFSLKSIDSIDQYGNNNNNNNNAMIDSLHEVNNRLQLQSSTSSSSLTSTNSKNDYILNLITKPDRELNPLYYIRIKCTDQALNFNEQTIRIRVLDMNDEQPRFQKSIYRFNLPENSDKQVKSFNSGAVYLNRDNDNNNKDKITHTPHQSIISTSNGREDDDNVDGAVDSADHEDHYEYRIGRVLAEDNDQGENARIEYYLDEHFLEIKPSDSSVLPSAYLLTNKPTVLDDKNVFIYHHSREAIRVDQLFRIDSQTGMLYALKKFDVENVDLFRFNVYALDQPNQLTSIRHTGTAMIEIKITDVNDWPPLFIQTNNSMFNATDTTNKDGLSSSSSGSSSRSLGGAGSATHPTDNITSLDHNELNFVNSYIFHVKENRPAYWLVGRIIAIDLDVESKAMTHNLLNRLSASGGTSSSSASSTPAKQAFPSPTSYITLRIANDSPLDIRRTFNLHATQGYLRTSVSLDREKQSMYVFNVIAYDGNPSTVTSQTSTATVTVFVEDENDNDPVFIRPATASLPASSSSSQRQSNTDMSKHSPPQSIIHQTISNNLQEKQNGAKLNWPAFPTSMDDGKNDRLKQINHNNNNNLLKPVAQQISHNNNDKANIPVVLVHRRGNNNINNNDDDDFNRNEASHMDGDSRPLLQIEAIDADAGDNGKITYEISAGNTDNLFVLNPDTGILSLSSNLYTTSAEQSAESSPTKNTQTKQNSLTPSNPIMYMLRFEACDRGRPKRCALPIWVQLVIDPNEFPHLAQLSHLTNYLNPSLINTADKLNQPAYSIDQSIEHIEQAKTALLSGYLNSNLNSNNNNNNNNNAGLNKQNHIRFHEDDGFISDTEGKTSYPMKSAQYKNIWNVKSSGYNRQHDRQGHNQFGQLHHQQLFEHKTGLIQPGNDGSFLSHGNGLSLNHNNNHNNNNHSFVISEVAIVCLVIVFIILLVAIMVLIYLTRRKTFLLPVTASKTRVKDNNFKSHSESSQLKANETNSDTLCAPIQLSENASSFYRTMPEGLLNTATTEGRMSCFNEAAVGVGKSVTLSTDMMRNPMGSQPLIRRNSEPRLFFNTNMSRSTVQSALFTPQLQNNLTDSTYTPKSLFRPQTSRFAIEHEYQSLAPVIDNRTAAVMMRTTTTANAHSSRCLTPFFDYRSHHTPQHMIEQVGMRNAYRNWVPVHLQQSSTPMDVSHQSLVHLETTLNHNNNDNGNNREAVQPPKSPTIIYAASPDSHKHPIHFRGDSLPVYPMNQLQNTTTNLKSFHQMPVEAIPGKHLPPPHHPHPHHPLSTYQDISLLQATLRRHNRRSIIMTTHSNPMMTYNHQGHHQGHHHHPEQQQHQAHHSNRLVSTTNRNQFKTLHTPKHHTGGIFTPTPSTAATLTPRLMYSNNNLKPYHPNKTRYHMSTPLKDELECEQLLLLENRNNENNENQKLLQQPDDVINSNYVDSNNNNNNNSNDRDFNDDDNEHLTEIPNNLNFAKMSHDQQSTNQQTETNQLNYHENILHEDQDVDGDDEADGDDDRGDDDVDDGNNEECDNHQGVSGLLKSVSTNSLPMLIDMNNSSGEDINSNLNKFTQPQKWYPTSPTSTTMHLLSNQSNPCKYTYKTFREASFV
ncbi:unnamed protein product [Trichobilharzia szidati]|nr:unnamed protein product [Trichobilharzia szidati]